MTGKGGEKLDGPGRSFLLFVPAPNTQTQQDHSAAFGDRLYEGLLI
jgi:hypothetical protein